MKNVLLIFIVFICGTAVAQKPSYSLASNFSLLRNLTPGEKFWARGQNVEVNMHFSRRETGYLSVEYYTQASFQNNFTATAKSVLSSPQSFPFVATGYVRYRQLALGLKHYFKGGYDSEEGINIYGTAGFGFLFARVQNVASPSFDTTEYAPSIVIGQGTVKRLSFNAGLGVEANFRGPAYPFFTLRTWLPASSQSSGYLHSSNKFPFALIASIGLRVLFTYGY